MGVPFGSGPPRARPFGGSDGDDNDDDLLPHNGQAEELMLDEPPTSSEEDDDSDEDDDEDEDSDEDDYMNGMPIYGIFEKLGDGTLSSPISLGYDVRILSLMLLHMIQCDMARHVPVTQYYGTAERPLAYNAFVILKYTGHAHYGQYVSSPPDEPPRFVGVRPPSVTPVNLPQQAMWFDENGEDAYGAVVRV